MNYNCEVNELIGNVDNDNIEKFGVAKLSVRSSSVYLAVVRNIACKVGQKLHLDGDGVFCTNIDSSGNPVGSMGKDVTFESGAICVSNNNCTIEIDSKYDTDTLYYNCITAFTDLNEVYKPCNITTLTNNILSSTQRVALFENIAYLKQIHTESYVRWNAITEAIHYTDGDIALLKDSSVIKINCPSNFDAIKNSLYGSVEGLKDKDDITFIDISNRPLITGDIATAFGKMDLRGDNGGMYVFLNTGLSGNIEQLIAAWRTNVGTTGSVKSQVYGNQNVKLFGNALPTTRQTAPISWTADTMTINGTTYDNNGNIIP